MVGDNFHFIVIWHCFILYKQASMYPIKNVQLPKQIRMSPCSVETPDIPGLLGFCVCFNVHTPVVLHETTVGEAPPLILTNPGKQLRFAVEPTW